MNKRMRFGWVLAAIGALAMCAVALMLVVGRSSVSSQGSQAPEEEVIVSDRSQESPAGASSDASSAATSQEGSEPSQGESAVTQASPAGGTYSIPADAEYASNVVLVNIPEGMSAEEVESLLEQTGVVGSVHVSAEDLASGVVAVEVAQGMQVEDAINAIREESPELSAQPNFYYHAMLGDESDLRAVLDESLATQTEEPDEAADEAPADAAEETFVPEPTEGESAVDDVQEGQDVEVQEETEPLAPEEEPVAEDVAPDDPEDESVEEPEAVPSEDGPEALMEALSAKTDDTYADRQWALTSMRVFDAWTIARCEGKVAIAVLDQTPDVSHEDLAGNVAFFHDVHAGSDQMTNTKRHGTHVTGVASAVSNNALGVSGVSYNATLLVMNVFDGSGNCSTDDLCKAYARLMDMADEQNLHVINLSLGGKVSSPDFTDDAFLAVVDKAYEEHDIVTVAAAANASSSAKVPYYEYPGDAERVVSVMNLRQDGDGVERSTTSNYNVPGQRGKDICAPGSSIYSTVLGNGYGYESGTSMAAPQVSGVLALEFAANPDLTAEGAVSVLYSTAVDLGEPGWDEGYGYGEVDAYAAVQAAKGWEPGPEPSAPMPQVSGATRIPVGARATYDVVDGSIAVKGGEALSLSGNEALGKTEGVTTLSVLDNDGVERSTLKVEVYDVSGAWTIASSINRGYVLDVAGGSLYNGGNAQLYSSNGTRAQAWKLELQTNGDFLIRCCKTGKALDISGGSKANGGNAQQYASNGTNAQRWAMTVDKDNLITFTNKGSGKVLDVAGGKASNGRNVQQYTSNLTGAQKWELLSSDVEVGPIWEGVYTISSSVNSSYVLDVAGGSKANSANVQLYRSNGTKAQQWKLEYLGDDIYKVTNVGSGKVLDVAGGKLANSANVQQYSWNGTGAQRWLAVSNQDGSVSLFRAGTDYVLDLSAGKATNGRNIQQYSNNGSAAQRWRLAQY